MAHELTHVAQQQGATGVAAAASTVFRKTKGEEVVAKATTSIEAKDQLKAAVDVLRVALRDTKKGKAVGFNKQAGLKQVETAAKVLGLTTAATDSLKRDWEWLIDNRKAAETDDYRRKEIAFFSALRSPLATLAAVHPESHAENLLRNTPPQVVDVIFNVADATIPPLQLYTYAAIEGLLNRYVRPQLGLASTAFPTKAQLATVRTDKPISGFVALGLDDFMTEMNAPREPLSKFLPAGYDPKKAQEVRHINEKGREVRSAEFADLKTALQALLAMLKRRRTLFEQDAKAAGYATPTEEELVYWTYVYFNFGEFGGKQQLQKFKGKRKLSDWISNQEFPNSIKLLQTFKMLKAMKLF
jgi:hypothetical protein